MKNELMLMFFANELLLFIAVFLLPVSAVALTLLAVRCVFRKSWKRALRYMAAIPIVLALCAALIAFGPEALLSLSIPLYLAEAAKAPMPPSGHKLLVWEWSSGSGWFDQIVYDDSDSQIDAGQDEGCHIIKRFENHIYYEACS